MIGWLIMWLFFSPPPLLSASLLSHSWRLSSKIHILSQSSSQAKKIFFFTFFLTNLISSTSFRGTAIRACSDESSYILRAGIDTWKLSKSSLRGDERRWEEMRWTRRYPRSNVNLKEQFTLKSKILDNKNWTECNQIGGTQCLVFKVPRGYIWKPQLDWIFTEIMTQLLKIIHRPCCEQLNAGNIFYQLNYTCQLYHFL